MDGGTINDAMDIVVYVLLAVILVLGTGFVALMFRRNDERAFECRLTDPNRNDAFVAHSHG